MIPGAANPLLMGGSSAYQIQRSLRFRKSATAYLNKTFGTPTDRNKWSLSLWVKRGALDGVDQILAHGYDGTFSTYMYFTAANTLRFLGFNNTGGTVQWSLETSALFRDPSSHYHIVFVHDSNNTTSTDRVAIYVNGVRVTAFSTPTYPTLNFASVWNASTVVGRFGTYLVSTSWLDGYLSEVNFIDGQALTPSSFGQIDSDTGQWTAKKYTGTYGTNGFYLPFTDTTSATTLCYDASGNGNNWTPNNISTTAGATYDSMLDVPTNNYAVSNSLDGDRVNITTSNGSLTLTKALGSDSPRAASSIGCNLGKWYCEVTWASMTDSNPSGDYYITGVTTKEAWVTSSNGVNAVLYFATNAAGGANGSKAIWTGGSYSGITAYGTGYFVNGSIIGIALDLDAGTVTFYNNNVSQGAITLPSTSEAWFPYCTCDGTNNAFTNHWNFGQRPFAYTPPTGFKALHTGNLPAPTILKPNKHFDVVTYVGNGSTQSIASAQFAPELVWGKSRSLANSNWLMDSQRGTGVFLSSDQTITDTATSTLLTAFNANGFTLGASASANQNAATYVSWFWKAGGAAVTNNAGSISAQVSANPSAGFSIATFTAQPSGAATVGHGLGVAPKMMVLKNRGAVSSWFVYHTGLNSAGNYITLQTTNASTSDGTIWNSTAPTSSVMSVGTAFAASGNWVAYCFAEIAGYSKFGSYTGNGSADGPFVYCGFRPRYVMVKRTDAVESWIILDTARDTYNVTGLYVFANTSAAEADRRAYPGYLDVTANGFKLRDTSTVVNASAGSYIFMALAEAPFQSSLAR